MSVMGVVYCVVAVALIVAIIDDVCGGNGGL